MQKKCITPILINFGIFIFYLVINTLLIYALASSPSVGSDIVFIFLMAVSIAIHFTITIIISLRKQKSINMIIVAIFGVCFWFLIPKYFDFLDYLFRLYKK